MRASVWGCRRSKGPRFRITRFDGQRFETLGPDYFANAVAVPPRARYFDAWWAQDPDGLHVLVKGRVRTFSNSLVGPGVRRVTPDWRGNLWIVTGNAGVIRVSGDRLRRLTARDGLPTDHPDGPFSEGRDGDVWLHDGGILYRVRHGKAEPVRLPGAPIFGWKSFYVDDEGSTWLGSTATGLHRAIDATITVHSGTDALTLKGAYSILEDRTGALRRSSTARSRLERVPPSSRRRRGSERPSAVDLRTRRPALPRAPARNATPGSTCRSGSSSS